MSRPITETMQAVLRFANEGESLYTLCMNRAEHGARTGSIIALRRRGLLEGSVITDAGRAAIGASQLPGAATPKGVE